jgi:hypothetical protein
MKTEQRIWTEQGGWKPVKPANLGESAQVVLVFGARSMINGRGPVPELKREYPNAHFVGCSTAGEIMDTQVSDDSVAATAVHFEKTRIRVVKAALDEVNGSSFQAGAALAQSLEKKGLVHVFALSDGTRVNGSELARGMIDHLPDVVSVTGGLAGDADRFIETAVLGDQAHCETGIVTALALYGDRLKVGYGSVGGWDPFGPERLVTRSKANVLYELDGRSALELYKEYLGDHARALPAAGLLFPLSVRTGQNEAPLVRTILGVDEKEQSMTFAGDVPEGAFARLMKANFDRLIDGASAAARKTREGLGATAPDLAVLVSCVGRKLVLRQRTEEEVEAVRDVLGKKTTITGFYSYGEICPSSNGGKCELHNQTMTITALAES